VCAPAGSITIGPMSSAVKDCGKYSVIR
jgi:hypothetical protein